MLPYSNYDPAFRLQLIRLPAVTHHIVTEFGEPELLTGTGQNIVARTAVPEAAINEHTDLPSSKDQIRPARRCADVQAVTQPRAPESGAQPLLRACVFAPNPGHLLRSRESHRIAETWLANYEAFP